MMKLYDYISELNCVIPPELAEEWDNCGFQVNTGNKDVENVLVALEITEDVIEEAVQMGADLIITHHPMIFREIKKISAENALGRYIQKLIRADLPVFSCHTNFDICEGGNNDYIAGILDLDEVSTIAGEEITRCGEGSFDNIREVCEVLSKGLGVEKESFNVVGDLSDDVETIGICTGAGSEFLEIAKLYGCDLFITGDLKHHDARCAEEIGIHVIDAGHYGTECIFADAFIELMEQHEFDYDIEFFKSGSIKPPMVRYK